MEISVLLESFLFSALRVSTPLLLAGMGAVVASAAGVTNIALDGLMLASALAGVLVSADFGAWAGLGAAVLCGAAGGALLALFSQYLQSNIILSGLAINFIASGGTVFVLYVLTGDKGVSSSVASAVLPQIEIPFLRGNAIFGWLLGHNVMTYLAVLSVFAVYILLQKTRFGLHLRCVKENPTAALAMGLRVKELRSIALVASGALCGMAGAFLSMGYVSWFATDMTGGRGWIALCAQAMGTGSIGTAGAALLFGGVEASANYFAVGGMPFELARMLPYIAALLMLVAVALKNAGTNPK